MRFSKIQKAQLKIFESLDSMQVDFIYGAPREMKVRVLKSWDDQPAPQIDDNRVGCSHCPHLSVVADCDESVAADRESLG